MIRRFSLHFVFVLAMWAVPVFAANDDIRIEDPWVRVLSEHPDRAYVFFQLLNIGDAADRLMEVTTDAAATVAIERTTWRGSSVTYAAATALAVKPRSRTAFAPGHYQITLKELRAPLAVGQTVLVTLRFEHAGAIEIRPKVGNQLLGNR